MRILSDNKNILLAGECLLRVFLHLPMEEHFDIKYENGIYEFFVKDITEEKAIGYIFSLGFKKIKNGVLFSGNSLSISKSLN